jgi:hypothetical protein
MKQVTTKELLAKIDEVSATIRFLEELAKEHSLDVKSEKLYIACVAYKKALSDLLKTARS